MVFLWFSYGLHDVPIIGAAARACRQTPRWIGPRPGSPDHPRHSRLGPMVIQRWGKHRENT